MFSTTFEARHGFIPSWSPVLPVTDRSGNIGYPDFRLNMFVVIATDNPNHTLHTIPHKTTPTEATLLPRTKYETRVTASRDTLVIIAQDTRTEMFPLPPLTARSWYRELATLDAVPRSNLLAEIAKRYDGPDRVRLAGVVDSLRVR
jgi:hypothetical protein